VSLTYKITNIFFQLVTRNLFKSSTSVSHVALIATILC